MKIILLFLLLVSISFSSLLNISSFEANFAQTVTDFSGNKLLYSGKVSATTPQLALWHYLKPIEKSIYIKPYKIMIIEPELEQVIIKKVYSSFDFFKMIQKAKKVSLHSYMAVVGEVKYLITTDRNTISLISYQDEFDNNVSIVFTNQKQNLPLSKEIFKATIPQEYDIIRE